MERAENNDLSCGKDAKKLITELKIQLAAREDQIMLHKEYLNEEKEEWMRMTKVEQQLEESLAKKEEQLLESSKKLADLTEQLKQVNACLAGSRKTIETLEEKLDVYVKNLATAEENLQNAEDKCSKSSAKYLVLLKENKELEKMIEDQTTSRKITADQCNCREKTLEVEKLNAELSRVKAEAEELKKEIVRKDEMLGMLNSRITASENENDALKQQLSHSNEYKDVVETMQDKLRRSDTKLAKTTEELEVTRGKNELLEKKILELKGEVQSLEGKLEKSQNKSEENSKRVEALSEELDDAKEELIAFKTSCDASEKKILEYEGVVETMQDKLCRSDTKLAKTTEDLEATRGKNELLVKKILEIEREVQSLEGKLEKSQNSNEENSKILKKNLVKITTLENQLSETCEKLREITTKCSAEHESHITKLEKDISSAKERDLNKEKFLNTLRQKTSKLENELAEASDFREKVISYRSELEVCKVEKANLKKLLDENCQKILTLEKENENISLQLKEMQSIIQTSKIDTKRATEMEKKMERTLRQLTTARETLATSKALLKSQEKALGENILRLEMRLETFKENAALPQKDAEERHAESEQLKTLNEKLTQELKEKNQELVSLNKILKQLQKDVDRSKRKLKKYESQDEKENNINNKSADETSSNEPRKTRRGAKNNPPASASDHVSVIDPSGSKSKRVTRQTALSPPSTTSEQYYLRSRERN